MLIKRARITATVIRALTKGGSMGTASSFLYGHAENLGQSNTELRYIRNDERYHKHHNDVRDQFPHDRSHVALIGQLVGDIQRTGEGRGDHADGNVHYHKCAYSGERG